MKESVSSKAIGHMINSNQYTKPDRNMSMIGG